MNVERRNDFVKLIDERGYKVAAEIGVARGHFSNILLGYSHLERLYCVDSWSERLDWDHVRRPWGTQEAKLDAWKLLKHYGTEGRIKMVELDSLRAAEMFKVFDVQLDFCYIDANHGYDAVLADLNAWFPLVRKGGVFAGHDYDKRDMRGCKGVIRAVDEFAKGKKWKLNFTTKDVHAGDWRNSWWITV